MKVAIPHHAGEVAPCFEYCARITIFTVRGGKVVRRMDFSLKSRRELDRVRLLRDQGVSYLICGGVQAAFENLLRAGGIKVISWVEGTVGDLMGLFLQNRLTSGRHGFEQGLLAPETPLPVEETGKS